MGKFNEVMTVPVVATSHLTPEEGARFQQALADGKWGAALPESDDIGTPFVWEHGYIFYIGGPSDWDPDQQGIGPGFAALIKLARAEGHEWLRFDCDACEIEGIPTYVW